MNETQISVRGRQVKVPEIRVAAADIVVTGRWLRQAAVKDEEYVQGNPVPDPERTIAELKNRRTGADVFSFGQRIPDVTPRYPYPMLWDNAAAVSTSGYSEWLARLSQETRRNVRLAAKRGVVVRVASFDDQFVQGISGIYNETPVRHGRRFWHYGKPIETVKRDNGTFSDRSCFIGAYLGDELIGFIKMVYVDGLASIMQILSKNQHQDKRSTNALLAKAVEVCSERGVSHLLYCKYTYHRGCEDLLMEFKRRNGFTEVRFPRYYVPITLKGKLSVLAGLHRGVDLLPPKIVDALLRLRARHYQSKVESGSKAKAVEVRPAGASNGGLDRGEREVAQVSSGIESLK
jgi:hypothetical protein